MGWMGWMVVGICRLADIYTYLERYARYTKVFGYRGAFAPGLHALEVLPLCRTGSRQYYSADDWGN